MDIDALVYEVEQAIMQGDNRLAALEGTHKALGELTGELSRLRAEVERTTDSQGREWHVLVRADDSVCLYYTVQDQPGQYIVYDSLGRLSGEGARLARIAELEAQKIEADKAQTRAALFRCVLWNGKLLAACMAARDRLQATSFDGADMTGDAVFDQLTAAIDEAGA